tara:strand:- start:4376 stop:5101 length:726 start_codon:yes stop_codon:yes gene_type:complete
MIKVSEIFGPTIQGEGDMIGLPTLFLRVGGCDYRCVWCDTPHAVLSKYRNEWKPMTPAEILTELELLAPAPYWVTVSGGNPAIQKIDELMQEDRTHNDVHYKWCLETQGSVHKKWFADLDRLVLSPKPPSSEQDVDLEILDACMATKWLTPVTIKIVVFNDEDFKWAEMIFDRYKDFMSIKKHTKILQVGNTTPKPGDHVSVSTMLMNLDWLVKKSLDAGLHDVKVLPQLHSLLWGNRVGV